MNREKILVSKLVTLQNLTQPSYRSLSFSFFLSLSYNSLSLSHRVKSKANFWIHKRDGVSEKAITVFERNLLQVDGRGRKKTTSPSSALPFNRRHTHFSRPPRLSFSLSLSARLQEFIFQIY